jgi:hypothetical protein
MYIFKSETAAAYDDTIGRTTDHQANRSYHLGNGALNFTEFGAPDDAGTGIDH